MSLRRVSGLLAFLALVIIVTGTGRRTADAYDESATQAALLHVEYQ